MARILFLGLAGALVVTPGGAQVSAPDALRQSIEQVQQQILEQQTRPMVRVRGAEDMPPAPARLPVYFSPEPPPPGGLVDRLSPLYSLTWDAPAGLAPFVNEPFYTPLGTLLAEQSLSGRQRRRLDAFVALRANALRQLEARLAHPSLPADSSALSGAVEQEAEALRQLHADAETRWGRYRTYRVNLTDEGTPPVLARWRRYHVLRAAAFHDPGLSPAQRRLVVELGYDLQAGQAITSLPVPRCQAGTTVFFLPESARLQVPDSLPGALAAELDAFLAAKHQLKLDLAREILGTDGESDARRARALSALAQRQAPLIADLERLAESIRRGFAALPPPIPSALPAEIEGRAMEFRTHRNELQDELIRRLVAVRSKVLTYAPGVEGLRWESPVAPNTYVIASSGDEVLRAPVRLAPTPQQLAHAKSVGEKLGAVVAQYKVEFAAQSAALEARRAALFATAALALQLVPTADTPLTPAINQQVGAELRRLETARRLQDYRDYLTATLRPGLSPADRRLLFNRALVALNLPLPAAVRRPVREFD